MEYTLGLYEKAMPGGLSFHSMLSSTREAGFDYMEISIDESADRQARLDWSAAERLALHQALKNTEAGIGSMCLSGHRKWPLGSHDAAVRQRGNEMLRKAVLFAEEFGVRLIQLAGYDVYYEQGDADTRLWFLENLRKGVDFASTHGVILGFETMETPFMDTISKAMTYVREIGSPYLGVYPDIGNLSNACRLYGLNVSDEIGAGGGHIFAMHIKEAAEGIYRDMRFGSGRVDFVSGIRSALDHGIRRFVAECWHDGCEDWKQRIRETNEFVRGKFREAAA